MNGHLNFARVDGYWIGAEKCPTCRRRTPMFTWFQQWYGGLSTCLRCGDCWGDDGEMCERPDGKWRKEAREKSRDLMFRCIATHGARKWFGLVKTEM